MKFIEKTLLFLFILVATTMISSQLFSFQSFKQDEALTGFSIAEFVYTPPANISEDMAIYALIQADKDVIEISSLGINTAQFNYTLLTAKRNFIGTVADTLLITTQENSDKNAYMHSLFNIFVSTPKSEMKKQNFSEVMRLTQLIAFRKNQAYKIIDKIAIVEDKQNEYKIDGVDTSEGVSLIEQARKALIEERFDEAETKIDDANLKLDQLRLQQLRFRTIYERTQNFLKKYWLQSIIVLIILAVISPFIVSFGRKEYAKRKLQFIKKEIESLKDSLIKAQEDYFKYKTITSSSYKIKADSYKTRISELQKLMPGLESMSKGEKQPKKK